VVSVVDLQSKGGGFESHLMVDGNGFKAMALMYPILVKSSNENKENTGSQMGLTKKNKSISNIEAHLFNQI